MGCGFGSRDRGESCEADVQPHDVGTRNLKRGFEEREEGGKEKGERAGRRFGWK